MDETKVTFDPTKGQIVIVAGKRSKRPRLYSKAKGKQACPFCKGSERLTPPTRFALPNAKNWSTRAFENAFPALKPHGHFKRIPGPAFGEHEVIVETPVHSQLFQDLDEHQLRLVFGTYVNRMKALRKRKGVQRVLLIKNHGLAGGASIPHEHAQIFSFPFKPPLLFHEEWFCDSFKRNTGKCFYCYFSSRQHAVWENSFAKVVAPEFGRFGFELWVIPKKHVLRLQDLNEKEGVLLLQAIQQCIKKTYGMVDSYNFVVHETGHLHVEFYPRKSVWAGVELGAGVVINSHAHKDVLKELR